MASLSPTAEQYLQIRTLIQDTDTTSPILSDAQICALFPMANGNVFATAALCYETIARNKALLKLYRQVEDYKSEREATRELMAAAAALRRNARQAAPPVIGCIRADGNPDPEMGGVPVHPQTPIFDYSED